jgi:hypothetical protein
MIYPKNMLTRLSSFPITWLALFGSLLLSISAYLCHDPINVDGILYLHTAETYLNNGLDAALAEYRWPLYSILIAATSQLTHLSLLHAAQLLNAGLVGLLVVVFIKLIEELGGSRPVMIAATLIILLYPPLNHDRSLIVRDFGYWAFALLSLWQLLRFAKYQKWQHAFTWAFFMLLATLFRIEGGVLLLFIPFAFCLQTGDIKSRLKHFLQAYTLMIGIAAIALICWIVHPLSIPLGRIKELYTQLLEGFSLSTAALQTKIKAITQLLQPDVNINDVSILVIIGLLGLFIWRILTSLGLANIILSYHAHAYKLHQISRQAKSILWSFTLINAIILLVFLGQRFFLSERYIILLSLSLLLWLPFSLVTLYENWRTQQTQGLSHLFPLICLLMVSMLVSSVGHFGHSKGYIVDAGTWLKQHISRNDTLYSNSQEILFYADRSSRTEDANPSILQNGQWKKFDFLALRFNHKQPAIEHQVLKQLQLKPIQIFSNHRRDQVLILQVPHTLRQ